MVSYSEYSTMFVYFMNSCHVGERLWSLHGCLQALGDMPLGSLEHDGGVGAPAQKFGLFVGGRTAASFGDRLLAHPQQAFADTPKKQPTTNPMHGTRSLT